MKSATNPALQTLGSRRGLQLECLEDRCVPATLMVTSMVDDLSAGTLRSVLITANINAEADTIIFDASLSGQTITIDDSSYGSLSIYNDDLEIDGSSLADRVTISGNDAVGVFGINGDINVGFNSVIIQNGNATAGDGGGIMMTTTSGNLTLENVLLQNNNAVGGGGGVFLSDTNSGADSTLTISNSVISGNQANSNGGGFVSSSSNLVIESSQILDNISGNVGNFVAGNGVNTVSISNSTFSGNIADFGGAMYLQAIGAGSVIQNTTITGNTQTSNILGGGGITFTISSTAAIINSTISGNSSNFNGGGLGIFSSTITIANSTITGNTADVDDNNSGSGGGVYIDGTATVTVNNSIIAGNIDNNNSPAPDVLGMVVSNNANIIGDGTGSTGFDFSAGNDVNLADAGSPALNEIIDLNLADNGGPTLTHALIEGGIAINAGINADAVDVAMNPLSTDQRGPGFNRIVDSIVDIGAFEFNPTVNNTLTSTVGGTTFTEFTADITGTNITLNDIQVTGGLARQLIDHGDGTYTFIVAPNTVGNVTVSAPGVTTDELITVFNPVTFGATDGEFVRNLYTVVFARAGSDAEVEFWINEMANGAGRIQVIQGFLASDEFTASFASNADLIEGIYQVLFERDAETDFWTDELNDGTPLDDVLQSILSSEEFYTRAVQETYNEFLLRPADTSGQAYWVDELLAGNLTLEQMRLDFQNSSEAQMI